MTIAAPAAPATEQVSQEALSFHLQSGRWERVRAGYHWRHGRVTRAERHEAQAVQHERQVAALAAKAGLVLAE